MADVAEIFERLSQFPFEDRHFGAAVAILRAQNYVAARISSVLATFNMILADWTVLNIVKFAGADSLLKLGEISELLKVHPTTVANAVDRLEDSGFVEKIFDISDRRTVCVTLSNRGMRHLARIQEQLGELGFGVDALSEIEADQLILLLSKIRKKAATPESGATLHRRRNQSTLRRERVEKFGSNEK